MGGSTTINAMVYSHFEVSTKLKVKPFTLVIYWVSKITTQEIKNKLDNISV